MVFALHRIFKKISRSRGIIPIGAALFLIFFPAPLFASAQITEVMYDLEGSDDGREWIEVRNTGTEALDLSGWRFFENNTNHAIAIVSGGAIPPGGYAVIADNSSKFLADWPGFSGVLYDSVFSLINSGELLILRDSSLADVDTLTYDTSIGAAGDGMSLQKEGNGAWVPRDPTPGAHFAENTESQPQPQTQAPPPPSPYSTPTSSASMGGSAPPQSAAPFQSKTISASAEGNRTVFVGADSVFEARVTGVNGKPLKSVRAVWTFGNGDRREGQRVTYTFAYSGVYVVVLDVSNGPYTASDRIIVNATPAPVALVESTDAYVSIENRSDTELDLGGWILATPDGGRFVFPRYTIMLPRKEVHIMRAYTGLDSAQASAITLLYPNEALAASYQSPPIANSQKSAAPQSGAAKKTGAAADFPAAVSVGGASVPKETGESEDLITAPLVTLNQTTPLGATLPPLFGWIAALLALIGITVVGVLFIRGGEYREYTIQEVKE